MPKLQELTGKHFGKWLVLRRAPNAGTITRWVCRCTCGAVYTVQAGHLRRGASMQCRPCSRNNLTPWGHGWATRKNFSRTYRIWRSMRGRVVNPSRTTRPDYKHYKHVKLAVRWTSFTKFLEDMGECPSEEHELDRFPNRRGDYKPGNCRWATSKQQVDHLPQNQKGYKHKTRRGIAV